MKNAPTCWLRFSFTIPGALGTLFGSGLTVGLPFGHSTCIAAPELGSMYRSIAPPRFLRTALKR